LWGAVKVNAARPEFAGALWDFGTKVLGGIASAVSGTNRASVRQGRPVSGAKAFGVLQDHDASQKRPVQCRLGCGAFTQQAVTSLVYSGSKGHPPDPTVLSGA